MRKILAVLCFLFAFPRAETESIIAESAESAESEYSCLPLYRAFDGILLNSGKTLVRNYGLNSAVMATGTKALIQTGKDWDMNRFANHNKPFADFGLHAYYIGFAVPIAAPLSLYGIGLGMEDAKLQTAAVATAQASLISAALTTSIKAFTGRVHPNAWDWGDNSKDSSGYFEFGFMKRGAFSGWPSGHSTSAWAMAATLTEFYESPALAAGLYGYAIYISASASISFHWLSDVCAGALFGYSIGKTVGRHFSKKDGKESQYSLIVLPDRVMVARSF